MCHSLLYSSMSVNRARLVPLLLVLVLVTAAFAPAALDASDQAGSAYNNSTFVLATTNDLTTLDPALAYDTASNEVIQNVYETLVFYNEDNASLVVPQLASTYELSSDQLTWTFHIRSGVTFHNGAALKPSDVAYSFQRGLLQGGTTSPQWLLTEVFLGTGMDDISLLLDPYGSLYNDRAALSTWDPAQLIAACQQVKAAITANDAAGTVTMHLAQPWGPFLTTIAGTWGSIMNKAWTVSHGGWDDSCNTWQNWYALTSGDDPLTTFANGTGPFKLDHWNAGAELVLTRNANYWRAPAQLSKVVFQIVPDYGMLFNMLQDGTAAQSRPVGNTAEADNMVGEDCLWNITTAQYNCSLVNDANSLRRYIGRPSIMQDHILLNFNMNNTEGSNPYLGSGRLDGKGIPPDFFSDVHIRKAFSYCFNWDTFDQSAYNGAFVQAPTLALEGMPGYNLNAPHYTYNPTKCASELGLADLDHDGIPSVSDTDDVTQVGFHFTLPYNDGNTTRRVVMEIFASNLAKINSKYVIDVLNLPWSDYMSSQRASLLPIMTGGWLEDIHDPHNWYSPYLIGAYGSRANLPDDLRSEYRDLIEQGVSASDYSARDAIYQQLNQLVYDTAPLILLGGATNHDFTQRWETGRILNQAFPGNYYYPIQIIARNVNLNVAGSLKEAYDLVRLKSRRVSYPNLNNGPVQVQSADTDPILASQRVIYNGISYSEMMGLPAEQLSKEYLFPYYNNVAMDSQLRVSNVGGADTTIKVYLGSSSTPIDSYTLAAGGATRKNYTGRNSGPLRVTSSASNILTTIRVLYAGNSYSELMGLPAGQLAKEYLFPYYNNVAMDSQLRVSNVGGADTTIKVYLGSSSTPIDSYTLAAGGATRKNYANKNSGPLRVTSSDSNILTTIRVLYAGNSLSELMGYPVSQLAQKYWYPVYDNSLLDSQLRVSNVGTDVTTITVYAGGAPIDSYTLNAGAATRKNYPKNTGPLLVVSSGQPILTTARLLYGSSYYEMTGLPESQLSTQYFFPWYNNSAMNSELRFAVP
jgi:peptide/nickel transport system substrate-binding protein